jgi:glutaredoxin
MNIILYKSLVCPQCKVIQAKLDKKGISYEMEFDIDKMTAKGIKSIPTLEVDGERITGITNINNWIKVQEDNNG